MLTIDLRWSDLIQPQHWSTGIGVEGGTRDPGVRLAN